MHGTHFQRVEIDVVQRTVDARRQVVRHGRGLVLGALGRRSAGTSGNATCKLHELPWPRCHAVLLSRRRPPLRIAVTSSSLRCSHGGNANDDARSAGYSGHTPCKCDSTVPRTGMGMGSGRNGGRTGAWRKKIRIRLARTKTITIGENPHLTPELRMRRRRRRWWRHLDGASRYGTLCPPLSERISIVDFGQIDGISIVRRDSGWSAPPPNTLPVRGNRW